MIEFQLNDEFTIAQGKDKLKIKITALAPKKPLSPFPGATSKTLNNLARCQP